MRKSVKCWQASFLWKPHKKKNQKKSWSNDATKVARLHRVSIQKCTQNWPTPNRLVYHAHGYKICLRFFIFCQGLSYDLSKLKKNNVNIIQRHYYRVGSHLNFQTVQNETFQQSVQELSGTYSSSFDVKSISSMTVSMTSKDFSEVYWYSGLPALFFAVFQTSVDFLCKNSWTEVLCKDISIVSCQTTLYAVRTKNF